MRGETIYKSFPYATAHLCAPSCQEQLAEMVHTRDGSRAVREFIARGNAKVPFCFDYIVMFKCVFLGPQTNRQGAQATRRSHGAE